MLVRRFALTGLIALVLATCARAQTYPLAEAIKEGDCYYNRIEMRLAGEMRVFREARVQPMKLIASAEHAYPERVLVVADGMPVKVARHYDKAESSIQVASQRRQNTLRADRRLVVAQWHKDEHKVYSPTGALAREEIELVGEHFDTLALPGLLPGKDVSIGAAWKLSNAVVQGLCHFEGLAEQTIEGKLVSVENQIATISFAGAANGIEVGALIKLTVEGTLSFDLAERRIVRVAWQQKDEREQGPASPASSMSMTASLERKKVDPPISLSDIALVSVPDGFEPPPVLAYVDCRDAKNRYQLLHGREWQTVSSSDSHLVMRCMERGDFVAQVTITPWTKAEKGKHLSADEFKQAMADTPGWVPEEELQAGEVPAEGGKWIYRLATVGQLDGNKVMQSFYLVAGPDGDQVVLVFTFAPKQASRLGTRDLSMAASMEFPKGQ